MFSKELSASLLFICESRKLTYETASELCDVSSRQFGNIVRKKSAPTITTLEKLCKGLDLTPNDLLGFSSRQSPMLIKKVFHGCLPEQLLVVPVCPRCDHPLNLMSQFDCKHCGQHLSWQHLDEAQLIKLF